MPNTPPPANQDESGLNQSGQLNDSQASDANNSLGSDQLNSSQESLANSLGIPSSQASSFGDSADLNESQLSVVAALEALFDEEADGFAAELEALRVPFQILKTVLEEDGLTSEELQAAIAAADQACQPFLVQQDGAASAAPVFREGLSEDAQDQLQELLTILNQARDVVADGELSEASSWTSSSEKVSLESEEGAVENGRSSVPSVNSFMSADSHVGSSSEDENRATGDKLADVPNLDDFLEEAAAQPQSEETSPLPAAPGTAATSLLSGIVSPESAFSSVPSPALVSTPKAPGTPRDLRQQVFMKALASAAQQVALNIQERLQPVEISTASFNSSTAGAADEVLYETPVAVSDNAHDLPLTADKQASLQEDLNNLNRSIVVLEELASPVASLPASPFVSTPATHDTSEAVSAAAADLSAVASAPVQLRIAQLKKLLSKIEQLNIQTIREWLEDTGLEERAGIARMANAAEAYAQFEEYAQQFRADAELYMDAVPEEIAGLRAQIGEVLATRDADFAEIEALITGERAENADREFFDASADGSYGAWRPNLSQITEASVEVSVGDLRHAFVRCQELLSNVEILASSPRPEEAPAEPSPADRLRAYFLSEDARTLLGELQITDRIQDLLEGLLDKNSDDEAARARRSRALLEALSSLSAPAATEAAAEDSIDPSALYAAPRHRSSFNAAVQLLALLGIEEQYDDATALYSDLNLALPAVQQIRGLDRNLTAYQRTQLNRLCTALVDSDIANTNIKDTFVAVMTKSPALVKSARMLDRRPSERRVKPAVDEKLLQQYPKSLHEYLPLLQTDVSQSVSDLLDQAAPAGKQLLAFQKLEEQLDPHAAEYWGLVVELMNVIRQLDEHLQSQFPDDYRGASPLEMRKEALLTFLQSDMPIQLGFTWIKMENANRLYKLSELTFSTGEDPAQQKLFLLNIWKQVFSEGGIDTFTLLLMSCYELAHTTSDKLRYKAEIQNLAKGIQQCHLAGESRAQLAQLTRWFTVCADILVGNQRVTRQAAVDAQHAPAIKIDQDELIKILAQDLQVNRAKQMFVNAELLALSYCEPDESSVLQRTDVLKVRHALLAKAIAKQEKTQVPRDDQWMSRSRASFYIKADPLEEYRVHPSLNQATFTFIAQLFNVSTVSADFMGRAEEFLKDQSVSFSSPAVKAAFDAIALLDNLLFASDAPLSRHPISAAIIFNARCLLLCFCDCADVPNPVEAALALYNAVAWPAIQEVYPEDLDRYALDERQKIWFQTMVPVLENRQSAENAEEALLAQLDAADELKSTHYGPENWKLLLTIFKESRLSLAEILRHCPDSMAGWPRVPQSNVYEEISFAPVGAQGSAAEVLPAIQEARKAVVKARWSQLVLVPPNERDDAYNNQLAAALFEHLPLIRQFYRHHDSSVLRPQLQRAIPITSGGSETAINWGKLDVRELIKLAKLTMYGFQDPGIRKEFPPSFTTAMQLCLLGLCKPALTDKETYDLKILQAGLLFRGDVIKRFTTHVSDNPIASLKVLTALFFGPELMTDLVRSASVSRLIIAVLNEIAYGVLDKGKNYAIANIGDELEQLAGLDQEADQPVRVMAVFVQSVGGHQQLRPITRRMRAKPRLDQLEKNAEVLVRIGIALADSETIVGLFLTSDGLSSRHFDRRDTNQRERAFDQAWRLLTKQLDAYLGEKGVSVQPSVRERTIVQSDVYKVLYQAFQHLLLLAILRERFADDSPQAWRQMLARVRYAQHFQQYVPEPPEQGSPLLTDEQAICLLAQQFFGFKHAAKGVKGQSKVVASLDVTANEFANYDLNGAGTYCKQLLVFAKLCHLGARMMGSCSVEENPFANFALRAYIKAGIHYPKLFSLDDKEAVGDFRRLIKVFFPGENSLADQLLQQCDLGVDTAQVVLRSVYFYEVVNRASNVVRVKQLLDGVFTLPQKPAKDFDTLLGQLLQRFSDENPAFVLLSNHLKESGLSATYKALMSARDVVRSDDANCQYIADCLADLKAALVSDGHTSNTIVHQAYADTLVSDLMCWVAEINLASSSADQASIFQAAQCAKEALFGARRLALSNVHSSYDLSQVALYSLTVGGAHNHSQLEFDVYVKQAMIAMTAVTTNGDDAALKLFAMNAVATLPMLVVLNAIKIFREVYLSVASQYPARTSIFKGLACDDLPTELTFSGMMSAAVKTVAGLKALDEQLKFGAADRLETSRGIMWLDLAMRLQPTCEQLEKVYTADSVDLQAAHGLQAHLTGVLSDDRLRFENRLAQVKRIACDMLPIKADLKKRFDVAKSRDKFEPIIRVLAQISPAAADLQQAAVLLECDEFAAVFGLLEKFDNDSMPLPLLKSAFHLSWELLLRRLGKMDREGPAYKDLMALSDRLHSKFQFNKDDKRAVLLAMLPTQGHADLVTLPFFSRREILQLLARWGLGECAQYDLASMLKTFWVPEYAAAIVKDDAEMLEGIQAMVDGCDEAIQAEFFIERWAVQLAQVSPDLAEDLRGQHWHLLPIAEGNARVSMAARRLNQWLDEQWQDETLEQNDRAITLQALAGIETDQGLTTKALSHYRQLISTAEPSFARAGHQVLAEGEYYLLLLKYCREHTAVLSYDVLLVINDWLGQAAKSNSSLVVMQERLQEALCQYTHDCDRLLDDELRGPLKGFAAKWFNRGTSFEADFESTLLKNLCDHLYLKASLVHGQHGLNAYPGDHATLKTVVQRVRALDVATAAQPEDVATAAQPEDVALIQLLKSDVLLLKMQRQGSAAVSQDEIAPLEPAENAPLDCAKQAWELLSQQAGLHGKVNRSDLPNGWGVGQGATLFRLPSAQSVQTGPVSSPDMGTPS